MPLYETREIFGEFIRLIHVKNPGIAFGISVGNYTIFFIILSFFATLLIAYYHWNERKNHPLIVIGLGLIFGGAIGNLIDRMKIFFVENYEGVIDFIDVGVSGFRWYTFNVADTAVTIGIILYFLHDFIIKKQNSLESID